MPLTPGAFLKELQAKGPAPVTLLLGPEMWSLRRCRAALKARALPPEAGEDAYTRHDLAEVSLAEVIDDARAMSLFASDRFICCTSAEAALPRIVKADAEESDPGAAALVDYLGNPTPGVTLVLECSRFTFDGDDKAKVDRVRKFYGKVPVHVEFPACSAEDAMGIAQKLAKDAGVTFGPGALELLVEATGAEPARIEIEIEKLSLFAEGRPVEVPDVTAMVPNGRATTIFALVGAIGKGNAEEALGLLDTLVSEGEYLPLALTFLSTQFRLALAAKEAKLTNANAIQSFFQRQGVPMWRSRAEQVAQTAGVFTMRQLAQAMQRIYRADRDLRGTRVDDRTVMEEFVLALRR